MWNWFNCYLSGRHDFGVWCDPGAIFLRCLHCGRRSSGWAIDPKAQSAPARRQTTLISAKPMPPSAKTMPRVIPFDRVAVR